MQKYVDDNKRTVHFRGHAFLPFVADFFFWYIVKYSLLTDIISKKIERLKVI